MVTGIRKIIYILLSAAISVVLFAVPAYAENYVVSGCTWDEGNEGKVYAVWDEAEDRTQYNVKLFKGEKAIGLFDKTGATKKDFTKEILDHGVGSYYFAVYPQKGGKSLMVTSEPLIVDSDYFIQLRHANKKEDKSADTLAEDKKTINVCYIYLIEKKVNDGELKDISLKHGSYSEVDNVQISAEYENRKPGEKVIISADISPKEGYRYSDNVEFKCACAKKIDAQKTDAGRYHITMEYYPSVRLGQPSNMYLEDGRLHWDPVKYATRYMVRLYSNDEILTAKRVTTNSIDISSYIDEGCTSANVIAFGPKGNESIMPSKSEVLEDVDCYSPEGWQFRKGHWYYFIDGEKADPGWIEDTDGNWYYLDSKSRMKTGRIKDEDGNRYFLNDGSVEGLPLGALVDN